MRDMEYVTILSHSFPVKIWFATNNPSSWGGWWYQISNNIFKRCDGVFLTFDLADDEDFRNSITFIERIEEIEKEICIILIGNMADLNDYRKVTFEEASKFAELNGI